MDLVNYSLVSDSRQTENPLSKENLNNVWRFLLFRDSLTTQKKIHHLLTTAMTCVSQSMSVDVKREAVIYVPIPS
jgi:hypothetical protein